jgi:AbrB family looped-hinge helix DNA binding protein
MKQIAAAVTQRSQVTIPVEVRRLLGISAHDRVIFVISDHEVRLLPATFSLESAAGSVPALANKQDVDEQIREAKEEKSERDQRRVG